MAELLQQKCLMCPTEFVASKPWHRFCSDHCRQRFHTERNRQALAFFTSVNRPSTAAST